MKRARLLSILVIGVALTLGATGCKRKAGPLVHLPPATGPGDTAPQGPATISPGPAIGDDPTATAVSQNTEGVSLPGRLARDKYGEEAGFFKEQVVYFGFDQASVRPDERTKIEAVATYLKNEPRHAVEIEGHCDERGTEEYNRSLGEKRAQSTREYLISLGVPAERVFTISFGEDKPADAGHDEAAWAKNRRAEFVLLKPRS